MPQEPKKSRTRRAAVKPLRDSDDEKETTMRSTPAVKLLGGLQEEVDNLVARYGYLKINLVHGDGETEGIWAVPVDDDSATKLKTDVSDGEAVYARVCSPTMGWNGLTWGGLVKARTRGALRAEARYEDQIEERITKDRDAIRAALVQAPPGKKKKTPSNIFAARQKTQK